MDAETAYLINASLSSRFEGILQQNETRLDRRPQSAPRLRFGWGDPGRIRKCTTELVARAPDVLFSGGYSAVAALQWATATPPTVFANASILSAKASLCAHRNPLCVCAACVRFASRARFRDLTRWANSGCEQPQQRKSDAFHASLSPAEYEALIARFGFHVLQHTTNDAQAGGRTVWLCRRNKSPWPTTSMMLRCGADVFLL